MSLRQDIARAAGSTYINVGKRLFGVGKNTDQSFWMNRIEGKDSVRANLDTYIGTVFTCVNAISEEVGKYQPHFFKQNGDTKVEVVKHPFLDLLSNPQPLDMADGLTQYDLFEATQSFLDLQGECFWYLPYGKLTKQPKEIHILRSDKMGISLDDSGEVDGYYLKRGNGQNPIPFSVMEIVHFKRFNPNNPYRGMAVVDAARDYIETEEASSKYTKNFFKNNAGLSGVLSIKGEVSRNAFKKFARAWREKYEGVDNAGKVAIVRDTDSEFTKVGLGLNELDMKDIRTMAKDDVFMMFRTPRALFGLSDDTGLGRASVETLEYIFAKRCIEPKLEKMDSILLRALQKYFPDDAITSVGHENIIPADKDFELKQRQAAVDTWQTRDEIREQDGLDARPGGDVLRAPINSIPLSDSASAAEAAAAGGKTLLRRGANGKLQLVIGKKEVAATATKELQYEHKEQFRLRIEHNANQYAKLYQHKFVTILRDQEQDVLGRIGHLGKDLASQLFDLSDASGQIEQGMYPILLDMVLEQGSLALLFAGEEDKKFDINMALENALRNSTARMANNFNQQTMDELSTTLAEGIQAGESQAKLAARVSATYDGATGYRAERVARTESANASGEATIEAYKQTGYVTAMTWFANPDACRYCAELDGATVGLTETFVNQGDSVDVTNEDGSISSYEADYGSVDAPPLHPNCACTIIPATPDKEV